MSDQKETGGPAFPTIGSAHEIPGMSLRDYFAAHALTGVINDLLSNNDNFTNEAIAKGCYEVADAMLLERDK